MKNSYHASLLAKYGFEKYYKIKDSSITEISYYKLISLLENKESFHLVIGGAWCPNCIAFYPILDEYAKEQKINVYSYNPRKGYKHKRINDIRFSKTKDTEQKMQKLSSLLCLDLPLNVNSTYKMSVPIYMPIINGKSVNFWSGEYFPWEITEELKEKIKNEIKLLQ